jgi:copper chaperone CopZ
MKSMILFITFALSITAVAETATFTVDRMHCGGCRKMVTKAVCDDSKIAATVSECTVTVNEKTQTGTVILKSKDTTKIDTAAVEAAITSAGEEYKVSKKEIKK